MIDLPVWLQCAGRGTMHETVRNNAHWRMKDGDRE
jgi:hypothetical protein